MPGLPIPQPVLRATRVALRPFRMSDAADVRRLAGEREVAEMTLNVPYPYPDGAAETFIGSHPDAYASGRAARFAIVDATTDALLGAMGLEFDSREPEAELGYWIGRAHWSRGYATEAGEHLLAFAFGAAAKHRVHACHVVRNPASGRVMQKLGMRFLHVAHGMPFRHGTREDYAYYEIRREDWLAR